MSDFLPDTEDLRQSYCPACEPSKDVFEKLPGGKVWMPFYCGSHQLDYKGADDAGKSVSNAVLSSGSDADGRASNTAACDVVHRGKR